MEGQCKACSDAIAQTRQSFQLADLPSRFEDVIIFNFSS
jgi:hypothetical protein